MTRESEHIEAVEIIEVVVLADHGRYKRRPPRAHRYVLDIDGHNHTVHQHAMKVVAILDLVGKGEGWQLELILADDEIVVCAPDDTIIFSERCIVAFRTKQHHHHPHPMPPGPPVPPPETFVLNVVVNGAPVAPEASPDTILATIVAEALSLAKVVSQPSSEWQLRYNGNLLNQNLTVRAAHVPSGATLYLSLGAGGAGEGRVIADPAVSRAKFEAEVAAYRAIEHGLIKRGQWLLEATFPEAFVVFAASVYGAPTLVPFGVVVNFENYDFVPPSVKMVHPMTRIPFKGSELPIAAALLHLVKIADLPNGDTQWGQQNYMQWHSPGEVPFMCMPGVREYHDHSAHTGDNWLTRRGGVEGTLYHLLDVIYLNSVKNVQGLQTQVVLKAPIT